jgi:serine/threonine-protein phosphatase 2A regulatory subunit A
MVRRQAGTNLAKFVKSMPATIVIEEIIPLFQHLASDDQDSVRLLTVDILIAIAEVVPKEQQSSHGVLLTALRSLFEDKSWRVRYMVADRFEKIAKAVDNEVVTRDLVPAFVKLLKDTEAEVRSAIAGQIPGKYHWKPYCLCISEDFRILRSLGEGHPTPRGHAQHRRIGHGSIPTCACSSRYADQRSRTYPWERRVRVCRSIWSITLTLSRTIAHLLPMFLTMLKDEFPDVRLNIISKLELVNNGKPQIWQSKIHGSDS